MSKVRVDSPFKASVVPVQVINLWSAWLAIVGPADTVSNVGSAPLFARRNLPSLDDVPCGSLSSVTAWSAILAVETPLLDNSVVLLLQLLFWQR